MATALYQSAQSQLDHALPLQPAADLRLRTGLLFSGGEADASHAQGVSSETVVAPPHPDQSGSRVYRVAAKCFYLTRAHYQASCCSSSNTTPVGPALDQWAHRRITS